MQKIFPIRVITTLMAIGATPSPTCQICGFSNHTANICCKLYEPDHPCGNNQTPLLPTPPSVNLSTYGTTSTWYLDTTPINHITLDLANLGIGDDYKGQDKLIVGNSRGLPMANKGSTSLLSHSYSFTLHNMLHILHIK